MPVMSFNKKLEQFIERLKQAGHNNRVEYHKKEKAGPRSAEYIKRMKTAFAKASKPKNAKSMYFAGTGDDGWRNRKHYFKLGEVLAQGLFTDEKNASRAMIVARIQSKYGKAEYGDKFYLWGTTGPVHVYQAAETHWAPSGLTAIDSGTLPRKHNPEVIARSKAKKAKENAKAKAKANAKKN